MNPMCFQRVRAILVELEDQASYRALVGNPDPRAGEFRQAVELARRWCVDYLPGALTVSGLEGHLQRLHALCVGDFATFAPAIVKAQAALRAA